MYKRSLTLENSDETFFLWGPRQTGKSTLLKEFPDITLKIDLLFSDLYTRYLNQPSLLRETTAFLKAGDWVFIDEVQKIPALLDEIHWLIENKKLRFILCGSSARKLKRGHANLLGGRALRFELSGLTKKELGKDWDLSLQINRGSLPAIYLSKNASAKLRSYCMDYLKEEIAEEGLTRNLPQFSRFLEMAAHSDTELISYTTLSRDLGVSSPTIKSYYEILFDTLIARPLEAYRERPKRRISLTQKVYFFDVGVVNQLAKRGALEPGSELFGKAFENLCFHELTVYKNCKNPDLSIHFWRLSTGVEVDFILGNMEVAIELKSSREIKPHHLKNLNELTIDHPEVKRRICVSLDPIHRVNESGIEMMPYEIFLDHLWDGKIISE